MWLTIPSKTPSLAKRRLAPALSPRQRRELHLCMLEDVIEAALKIPALSGICLVTACPEVSAMGQRFGAFVLKEHAIRGHQRAIVLAARHLNKSGVDQMMILPGDVPMITATDIDQVLMAHGGGRSMTLVPDHNRQGANCIIMATDAAPALKIGSGSFHAHIQGALDFGFEPRVVCNSNIARDIDTPDDLAVLIRRGRNTLAGRYLSETGIAFSTGKSTVGSPGAIVPAATMVFGK